MADQERIILNHYNISNSYPTEWPREKDESDHSESEKPAQSRSAPNRRKSKSRYSILERNDHDRRSLIPGSEKTRDGVENIVQRDEADPLGASESVVRILKQKGLPVEDDERLRNRFLLSSTTFTPALYLSQVHSDASTQFLLQGLEYLTRSIDQKSASLKVLVESNFERFVRAKTTIDNVYTEMRNQGVEPEVERPQRHSRHASKNSAHFRNASGQGSLKNKGYKPPVNDRHKHALTKESEYGLQGIKAPLIEVAVKAEEVWGPALGGREREENVRTVLASVEKCEGIFEAGAAVCDSIKHKEYERLVKEYSRARGYAEDAKKIATSAMNDPSSLTEAQIHQIVITGRMWHDVEDQINRFKRDVWRNLTSVQANLSMSTDRSHQQDHVKLISVLLDLGVEDNPIWVWLLSRYDYLKNKINSLCYRSRVEIEALRRRLANAPRPSLYASAMYLQSPTRSNFEDRFRHLDARPILELWDFIFLVLNNLLSLQGGVLGEVVDFWEKAQSFIDGKAQRTLPTGIDGTSRKHHRLSVDGVKDLQRGAVELVDLLREQIFSFFVDPPIDDISMLYSPNPTTTPNTPKSGSLSPFSQSLPSFSQDPRVRMELLSPPPPSPKRGEPWEEFAFWPPHANSLSIVHYLGKFLALVGTAAIEMAAIRPGAGDSPVSEKLKVMLNGVRERSTKAVCAAWNADAERCKLLEDWTRTVDRPDLTTMPSNFAAFEAFVLTGTQKILYIPEAAITKRETADIITPPPNKLLQMVRSQFVTSLYKVLSGMVENAEKPLRINQNAWDANGESSVVAPLAISTNPINKDSIDASDRNLRRLITLSNLKALRADIVPQLISQFETDFSVKLTDESKTIHDVLAQIDARLFQSYVRPTADALSAIIARGIAAPSWPPPASSPRPTEVRPYIYEALLLLVFVHTEVHTTTAPLTPPILSHLLEQISSFLLDAFKKRARYSLPALMQATLDVEFVAQTLSQFATDRASETQSMIYLELDRGTDQGARARLQSELTEMRAILKRLREGTRTEFACFRKVRAR